MTSKIQVNFRYRRCSEVLMIVSYKFLKFVHNLCFQGQGIHCWHSYWATMFGWSRKSRSTPGSRGSPVQDIPPKLSCVGDLENQGQLPVQKVHRSTDDSILWNFTISSHFMFYGVKESISDIPTKLLWKKFKNLYYKIICTSQTGSWSGISRSPKQGSSVGMSVMDSLTMKT